MCAAIGSRGEVLAQQAVGIFVSAALPGAVRVAEVDLQPRINPQVHMLGRLRALISGQRSSHLLGQSDDGARDSRADRFCTMTGKG
jgi:hypothetical protein